MLVFALFSLDSPACPSFEVALQFVCHSPPGLILLPVHCMLGRATAVDAERDRPLLRRRIAERGGGSQSYVLPALPAVWCPWGGDIYARYFDIPIRLRAMASLGQLA